MALTKVKNQMIKDALPNAKDFGAAGNNSTNDTTALSNAGEYAYLPQGQYVTTQLYENYDSRQSGEGELSFLGTFYNNAEKARIAANGNPATDLLRNNYNLGDSTINRVSALTLKATQTISTASYTKLTWSRIQEGAGIFFPSVSEENIYATNQSRIISFSGYVNFDTDASGTIRAVALYKNNVFAAQVNANPLTGFETTCQFDFTVSASAPDYYDIRVYHNGTGSIDITAANCKATIEVEDPYYLGGQRLLIYQGSWAAQEAAYGSYEALLDAVCQYDVLALSHIETVGVAPYPVWPVPPIITSLGVPIQDVGYDKLKRLIHDYKFRRPNGLVFGYISAAIDCPTWDTGGNPTTNTWTSTTYPNLQLWCNLWLQDRHLPIDGFFLDHFNAAFMSATNRDNVVSLIKKQYGKKVMVNITSASAAAISYATECEFLSYGDYLCLEGFFRDNGVDSYTASVAAVTELAFSSARGLLFAVVNEEAASTVIDNTNVNNTNGLSFFNSVKQPGWCYQYGRVTYDTIGTPAL